MFMGVAVRNRKDIKQILITENPRKKIHAADSGNDAAEVYTRTGCAFAEQEIRERRTKRLNYKCAKVHRFG
jgi:hypothetical protein